MINYAICIYQQTRLNGKQYTIVIHACTLICSRISRLQTLDVGMGKHLYGT